MTKNPETLRWVMSPGGAMGPHRILMLGDRYVGHFYEDASEGVDVEAVLEHMTERPFVEADSSRTFSGAPDA